MFLVLYRLNEKWKFLRSVEKILVSYTLLLELAVESTMYIHNCKKIDDKLNEVQKKLQKNGVILI